MPGRREFSLLIFCVLFIFSQEAWVSKVYYDQMSIGEISDQSSFIYEVERTKQAPLEIVVKSPEGKVSNLRYFEMKLIAVLKTTSATNNSSFTFVDKPRVELPERSEEGPRPGRRQEPLPGPGSLVYIADLKPLESPIPAHKSYSVPILPFAASTDEGKHLFFGQAYYSDLRVISGTIGLGLVESTVIASLKAHLSLTEIFDAMRSGKTEKLKKAIEANKDFVNMVDDVWGAPIHFAGRYGKVSDIELLLASGASLDTMDSKGNPVLHNVVHSGFMNNIEWLIKHTKNLNSKNKAGQTALEIAIVDGNSEIIAIFKKVAAARRNSSPQ